jgi:SAM-dependent methyltransferase
MGVYSTEEMADRTRATATAWGMGERMFFQVGDPARFRFKDGYFDMVVSDGVLNQWADPERVLAELGRITKPTGAILIRDLVRPNRLAMSRHLQTHGAHYPDKLRGVHAGAVRAGFTPEEFLALSGTLNLDRVEVLADATHVLIERRGTDDPGSWVTERERYQ